LAVIGLELNNISIEMLQFNGRLPHWGQSSQQEEFYAPPAV
jgi:hypothetical protein